MVFNLTLGSTEAYLLDDERCHKLDRRVAGIDAEMNLASCSMSEMGAKNGRQVSVACKQV